MHWSPHELVNARIQRAQGVVEGGIGFGALPDHVALIQSTHK